ncbi:MAG: hypothetical protein L0271_20280, partial [Gemmatimonadetes bacterium]|nr:hypothetical protein [Gemmatimonadota bacterium]
SFSVSMFVVDTVNPSVARHDTILRYRYSQPPAPGAAVVASVSVSVEPKDDALLRMVVRQTSRQDHGAMHGQHILVPDFTGDSLQLSSIVLGLPGQGGNWRRGRTELTVMPLGEFAGGDFRVFYEIYNLPEDALYTTQITIDRLRDAQGRPLDIRPDTPPAIHLRFEDVAQPDPAGTIEELRNVESDLVPGQYRVQIRITNLATRQSAATERLFSVTATR